MKKLINEIKQLQKTAGILKEAVADANGDALDFDDRVKVVYGNEFYGEMGTVMDIKGSFVIVKIDGEGEYSMHSTDVERVEDDEDFDDDDMYEGEKPGLWANIRAKRARGERPAKKGSKAYKSAVKAAKDINKNK
jgi:hypothetical protein